MNGPWNPTGGEIRHALVYGLALSGRAAVRFLLARGVRVTAVDARPLEALALSELAHDPRLALHAGREPVAAPPLQEGWPAVDLAVVSPGVPMDRPLLTALRAAGVPVIAELELAFPFLNGPVVAVTGTNGKSTTTALAGAMIAAAGRPVEVCGNIGEPLCDKVDGIPGRVFVVEVSSFQIEGLATFAPRAATLLNVTEDHLDRYSSFAAYAETKRAIFRRMGAEGVAVLNADDRETQGGETAARRRLFSRRGPVADGCFVDGDVVLEAVPGAVPVPLFALVDLPLAGVHNLENAMAAALLARAVGVPPIALAAGLRHFAGLPHRLERVGEAKGVVWFDDSKGTNPAATAKSLEGFADGTVHLILGGRNKGADLAALTPLVARKAKRVYLIGEAAGELAAALGGAAPVEVAETLLRAVRAAAATARPGEVVVLSPACASFDQFKNFVHRGEVFQQLVKSVIAGGTGTGVYPLPGFGGGEGHG